jgi:hypothetical protein
MGISKTKFEKDLRSIIGKSDYYIDLYKKEIYVGCIHLGYDDNFKRNGITKASVMADITIEKRTDYDYDADNGSTIELLAIWIENPTGYCFYEFDSWNIRSL